MSLILGGLFLANKCRFNNKYTNMYLMFNNKVRNMRNYTIAMYNDYNLWNTVYVIESYDNILA